MGRVDPRAPAVRWDPRQGQLEVWWAGPRPDHPVRLAFVSPVWLTFHGDQLLAVDLLDVPEAVSGACRGAHEPNGSPRPGLPAEYDEGWLWIPVASTSECGGEAGHRLTGMAEAEVVLDGPVMAGLRLVLDPDRPGPP